MQRRRPVLFRSALVLLILTVWAPLGAQKRTKEEKREERRENASNLPALISYDSDVRKLNLFYGAGGAKDAPDPAGSYTFLAEDLNGANPKFDVVDAKGVRWRVKLNSIRRIHPERQNEQQAETAASRLLWAAGYYVDEDYYLRDLTVSGLPTLQRGEKFVSPGGRLHGVRLKRRPKEVKKLGDWDWFANPFLGTRQLNGLRVMMALLNNWDLGADNNSIYEVGDERRFLVSDIGASFGKTGTYFSRSKGVLEDYASSTFIQRTTPEYVDFVMHSRPFFLEIFDFPKYRERTRMEQITKRIPLADARWLGEKLAQLSGKQLGDCFRAAGYTPEEVDGFVRVVQNRIAVLKAL